MTGKMSPTFECEDLDQAIDRYKADGYRLDMIFPADDPREARMSRADATIHLRTENHPGLRPPLLGKEGSQNWVRGRARMEYRDLIPDRLGGKVVASHIRLTDGGEVPDYVHYHKIDFQVIYCLKGRIKVVYEDQGEPFWLETGDLVLQPLEIRHRVLECTAGAEVIEITSPAEHETWVEHDLKLPSPNVTGGREFGGRRFFRYRRVDDRGARSAEESELIDLAKTLFGADSEAERIAVVTAFSRSLCQK
jgi:quercetin dioxygenase-like cupin family protein